jgi:mycothiol synthase
MERGVDLEMSGESARRDPAPRASVATPGRRQLKMLRPHLEDLPAMTVPPGYGLRTYQPGDERAWGEIMEATGGIGRDWTVEKVREKLIDREQFDAEGLFFATCNAEAGRPIASACVWQSTVEERTLGIVHMVCALLEHRGRGVGRLVTLAVLHRLRARGFSAAELSTDDLRLAAIKTYFGLGFVPVYLPDPEQVDDQRARWSAILAQLLGPAA